MPKKYEEMTPAERLTMLDTIMTGRSARKGLSAARRKAVQQLIKAHEAEYATLLKAAGGKLPVRTVK